MDQSGLHTTYGLSSVCVCLCVSLVWDVASYGSPHSDQSWSIWGYRDTPNVLQKNAEWVNMTKHGCHLFHVSMHPSKDLATASKSWSAPSWRRVPAISASTWWQTLDVFWTWNPETVLLLLEYVWLQLTPWLVSSNFDSLCFLVELWNIWPRPPGYKWLRSGVGSCQKCGMLIG